MTLNIMPISLSQGLYALVDGKDYEWLNRYKWYALKSTNTYYAVRRRNKQKEYELVFMHREILGLIKGDGKHTDHYNHCGLDNRQCNIRICTHQQNHQNRRAVHSGTSKYKGVSWRKEKKKWRSQICYNQKVTHLGSFDNEIDAAKTYDKKAKELFGQFAYTNI